MNVKLCLAVAALVFGGSNAFAGVIVTSSQTDMVSKQVSPAMVYVEGNRMKVVTPDTTVIFRGDQNRAWVIDIQKRTYMEFTQETMRAFGSQIADAQAQYNAAQAQLQAQLAQLPPDQRALVEAQLGKAFGGPPAGGGAGRGAPAVNYLKAGQSKTVSSWRCDVYTKTVGARKEEDVCVAPIATAGLTAADFRVLESFSAFMSPVASAPMLPHNDFMHWNDMNKAIGFQGVPLDTLTYSNGRPNLQHTVQKIERAAVPGNTFDLPPGLSKQEVPSVPRF